jgi:hypothetical protein
MLRVELVGPTIGNKSVESSDLLFIGGLVGIFPGWVVGVQDLRAHVSVRLIHDVPEGCGPNLSSGFTVPSFNVSSTETSRPAAHLPGLLLSEDLAVVRDAIVPRWSPDEAQRSVPQFDLPLPVRCGYRVP